MEDPDPGLVRAAAHGDDGAFTELMRAFEEPVWRFLCHLVGDDSLAEDLAQETFLRAHGGLGRFRQRSRFSTWLFAIARNAATDFHRQRGRQAHALGLVGVAEPAVAPEDDVTFQMGIDALPPKLREALVTVEVLGLRYREAAVVLDVAEGTVKSRVFQARRELAAWLRADAGDGREGER